MKKQENIDHDRLFKELLTVFFVEFIELFFPELREYLDRNSVTFLDKEVFTDVTRGEKYETDLIVQVRFAEQDSYFLIHIENQSSFETGFDRRMFRYCSRLHEKFNLPIYPIVIFSYDRPKKAATNRYQIAFPDFKVLQFNYRVI
ncbi:Rpn family recombination-promoting nuclease/putative transposase, partial [Spirulina sp. 06S082]|uniref:Rpn family recombination-promoting nuclease/putative transposase n=1 Tax=Spirulina sp. 06S082 TaxID=3110248 RepID=UPI002B212B6E